MMRLITILVLCLVTTACGTTRVEYVSFPHPKLYVPAQPTLPNFQRSELDCSQHKPVCKRIVEREALLKEHIKTLEILIQLHNSSLEQPIEN